jgi:hypothetical protein
MSKGRKFVDPIDLLYSPPPHKTKLEALRDFFYDSEEGSCLGRTPQLWRKYISVKEVILEGEFTVFLGASTVYRYQRFGISCLLHLQGTIVIGAW